MFIAQVESPYIGNKELCFSSSTFAIDAEDKEIAIKEIRKMLGKKDPEVQKLLCQYQGYKENQYFSIWLHRVPSNKKIVQIHGNVLCSGTCEKIRL